MQGIPNYLILACIFVTGFLISRLFVKSDLASLVVINFVKLSRGHIKYLILLILSSSVLLSSFIPNMITILTLIPILKLINLQYKRLEDKKGQLSTPIALSAIYGANIGGMASIIGSPANAVMIGFLPVIEYRYNSPIPGRENLNFFSWLAFGIPLALILVLMAWLLIYILLVPKKLKRVELDFSELERSVYPARLRSFGLLLSAATLLLWLAISILQVLNPEGSAIYAVVSVFSTLLFIFVAFILKFPKNEVESVHLLLLEDCFSDLPLKGILLLVTAVCMSGLLMLLRIPEYIGRFISDINALVPPPLIVTSLAMITTFTTEFLSNTVIALNFFPLAYVIAKGLGLDTLPVIIIVSLSSTGAFMTPVATPVNALGFGSLEGVSLQKMMLAGIFMNLLSSIWLSYIARYLISSVLL